MKAKKAVLRKLTRMSLAEMAVLELSNDPKNKTDPARGGVTVTTKEAYVWGALLAHVAENHPEIAAADVIRAAIGKNRKQIKRYYADFPPLGHEKVNVSSDFPAVPDALGLAISNLKLNTNFDKLAASAEASYKSLLRKGLIEDPLEILAGGILFSVIGLVPTSFTQKTKEGRTISKKLKAMFWSYEKTDLRGGGTRTHVEFRLLKMLKAFRQGMVGGFKNAMKDDEDES
jgi:hypothetical protein